MGGITVAVLEPEGRPHCRVLVLRGRLDASARLELEDALDEQIRAGVHRLVLDLGGVDHVSSAGWGVFAGAAGRLRDLGGDLGLMAMRPEVAEIYRLLEFHTIVEAHPGLDEALSVPG